MDNQGKFLEMLQEMKEIAAAQQNKMTREEIARYLAGSSLSEEQMRAVYQYLGENGIAVEGYQYISMAEETSQKNNAGQMCGNEEAGEKSAGKACGKDGTQERDATRGQENLRMYQQELSGIVGDLDQEEDMIVSFLKGEDGLRDSLIEMRLARVVELSEKYGGCSVSRDEIIAEGNRGLMEAMGIIEWNRGDFLRGDGALDREKFFGTLDMEVVHAMESYIDGETASKDWERAMLAKANLLHEAAKYLAEEMGKMPDVWELSEYTKIEPEEIRKIMGLYKNESV